MELTETPGDVTEATAINSQGDVIGTSYVQESTIPVQSGIPEHTVMFLPGQTVDLSTLSRSNESYVTGINASDQVVGSAQGVNTGQYATLYSHGQVVDLEPPSRLTYSTANAINDSGQILGTNTVQSTSVSSSFLDSNGTITTLSLPVGLYGNNAVAINNSGQIAGNIFNFTIAPYSQAFLDSHGTITNLGVLPGMTASMATAMNASGQIVGYSDASSTAPHGFFESGGQMQDVGLLPGAAESKAEAVNDVGQVVGNSGNPNVSAPGVRLPDRRSGHISNVTGTDAFLWQNGKMVDLNTLINPNSGWVLNDATGINDAGQICGNGTINGDIHAFLLTPQ